MNTLNIEQLNERIIMLTEHISTVKNMPKSDISKIIIEIKDIVFTAKHYHTNLDRDIINLESSIEFLETKF